MQVYRAMGVSYAMSGHRPLGSEVKKYFENLLVNPVPLTTGQMYCGQKKKISEYNCLLKYLFKMP